VFGASDLLQDSNHVMYEVSQSAAVALLPPSIDPFKHPHFLGVLRGK
jgi:hypothetical protein